MNNVIVTLLLVSAVVLLANTRPIENVEAEDRDIANVEAEEATPDTPDVVQSEEAAVAKTLIINF